MRQSPKDEGEAQESVDSRSIREPQLIGAAKPTRYHTSSRKCAADTAIGQVASSRTKRHDTAAIANPKAMWPIRLG